MPGYPFFYGNESLDQDTKFMGFSVDPLPENSQLNLAHASSLSIIVKPIQLGSKMYLFKRQDCR